MAIVIYMYPLFAKNIDLNCFQELIERPQPSLSTGGLSRNEMLENGL